MPIPLLSISLLAAAVPQDSVGSSSFFTARPWSRGAALDGDLSEGRFQGRRLFRREANLMVSPSDRIALWFGESNTTAFGRSSDSRFRSSAERSALRWRFGARRGTELAFQGGYVRPDDAVATTVAGSTTSRTEYKATRIYSGDLIASRGPYDAAVGYAVTDSRAGDSQSTSLSLGYQRSVARDLSIWAQGTLIGQTGNGESAAKGILRGQLRYAPTHWGAIVLEGSLFPSGMPYSESLGSFLLYNPDNSAAQSLKTKAIGYGTLRLSFNVRF